MGTNVPGSHARTKSEPFEGRTDQPVSLAVKRPGRPRGKKPGGIAANPVRMRAAALMLGGPVSFKQLVGSQIGKREHILAAVIIPWFTIKDGRYKLTPRGRDEYVEAMDGPEPVQPVECTEVVAAQVVARPVARPAGRRGASIKK